VGDPYTITVTGGMPNATVGLNASQCSPDFSRCTISPMSGQQDVALSNWMGRPMTGNEPGGIGKTDGNGNFSMSGTFTPAQVGLWTQTWNVGGVLMGLPQFTVSDPSGSTAYGGPVTPSGVPYYTLAQNNAPSATYTPAQLAAMAGSPAPASPPAAPPVIPPPSGGGGTFDTSGNGGGGSSSGFDLSSIPTWAWLAGAGIGAFLLFRGHH
jgi:hypothetical protein